jgi:hypothetical protein
VVLFVVAETVFGKSSTYYVIFLGVRCDRLERPRHERKTSNSNQSRTITPSLFCPSISFCSLAHFLGDISQPLHNCNVSKKLFFPDSILLPSLMNGILSNARAIVPSSPGFFLSVTVEVTTPP